MDQWRKRITRIATSFELANNKAELGSSEKQLKTPKTSAASEEEVSPNQVLLARRHGHPHSSIGFVTVK